MQLPQRFDNLRNLTATGVKPVALLHFFTLGNYLDTCLLPKKQLKCLIDGSALARQFRVQQYLKLGMCKLDLGFLDAGIRDNFNVIPPAKVQQPGPANNFTQGNAPESILV